MSTAAIYEIIGYVGSGLVLVSFLMTSVVKLRLVNCVGGIIFAVYALLIHSYPTMIMNICLVLINLYYLWKLRNSEPNYRLVSLTPGGDYVDFFLPPSGTACWTWRWITAPPPTGTAPRAATWWSTWARRACGCCAMSTRRRDMWPI